ncbi:DISP complex protein LRCH3-like isoform X2 [Antedon mediterranea]|uniref:DISP complex protein LRCH3-like isoform X2 n=1 Tax=Antedon mediterranea TaxID=105859 RepID=UPI003AF791DD
MAVLLSSPQSTGAQLRSLEKVLDDAQRSGRLNLSSRKIKDFPKVADKFDLRDTVDVDLSKNRFTELPEEICDYLSLENLNCYKNVLKSIPPSVNKLSSLTFLNLSRNQLTILPSELCNLSLEVLIVSNNKLVSLPEDIRHLSSLRNLDASCNEISTLPSSVSDMESLMHFNVRHNRLENLPEELSRLKLRMLDISCNKITHIPASYRKICTLEKFILDHNPLVSPSPQICMRGMIHIFKFLANEALKEEGRKRAMEEDRISRQQSHSNLSGDQFQYFHGKPGELRRAQGITDSGYVEGEKRWPAEMNHNEEYIIKRAENQRHQRRGNLPRPSALVIPNDNGFHDSDEVDGSDGDITPTQIHPPDDDFTMSMGGNGMDFEDDRPADIERLKLEMLQAEQLKLELEKLERERIQAEMEENDRRIQEQERLEEQRRLEEEQVRLEAEQVRLQKEKRLLEEEQRKHELKRKKEKVEEEKQKIEKEKEEAEEQEKDERRKAAKKVQEEQQRIMQRQKSSERLPATRRHPLTSSSFNDRTRRPTTLNTQNKRENRRATISGETDTKRTTPPRTPTATSKASTNGNGSLINGRTIPAKTEEEKTKRRENIISQSRHEAQLARRRLEEAKAKTKQMQKSTVNSHVKTRSPSTSEDKTKRLNGNGPGGSVNSSSTSKAYQGHTTGLAALKPRSSLNSGKQSSIDGVNPRYTLKREAQKMQEDFAQLDMLRKSSTSRRNQNNNNKSTAKKPDRRNMLRVNLEARLKHPLSDDLAGAIKDGYALCHLVNSIKQRIVTTVHVPPPSPGKLSMARSRKNVENFIDACRQLGVSREKLCSASDVLEEKGVLRVANTVQCLLMLYPGSNKAISTV